MPSAPPVPAERVLPSVARETPVLVAPPGSESTTPPRYTPLLDFAPDGTVLTFPLSVALRGEVVDGFLVDAAGARYEADPILDARLRLGARFSSERALDPVRLVVRYEHDLPTGRLVGGAAPVGPFTPWDRDDDFENEDDDAELALRAASLEIVFGDHLHLLGGVRTRHVGMGLVANDGSHGWTPGSALFADPRGGDRALAGELLLGPFGTPKVAVSAAIERVLDAPMWTNDDATLPGDDAVQSVASVVLGYGEPDHVGVHGVVRRQEAPDGQETAVQTIDLAGAMRFAAWAGSLALEAEVAFVWGDSELGPSLDYVKHDVVALGAAARGTLDMNAWGAVLDVVYASGDGDLRDDGEHAFRADVNFPLGLAAHRHVLAAQTARAVVTASDPALASPPAEDLDRIPTRQQVSNTIALFPRGLYRPTPRLELYGGPLLLFTPERLADPLQTELASGAPRNVLAGEPGHYLGTELDAGLRYRRLLGTTELTVGLEGGVFFPGNALEDAAGDPMASVASGRVLVDYAF